MRGDPRHDGATGRAASRHALALARPPTRRDIAFYRTCRFIAVAASRLVFPGRVLGREHLPLEGAYVLAPVHRSYVDWLLVARVTKRRLRYIVKQEVWKSRLVGRLLEALGAFPVNRSGADREALERSRAVLESGEPLVMFPEGTRRSGPAVKDLREGTAYLALRTGVPVVPVGIGGSEQAMPRGSKLPRPRRVDIVIGPVVMPPAAQGERPLRTSARAEKAMPGDEVVLSPEGSPRGVRVSRRAMSEFSDQVGRAIQDAFDAARRSVGMR